MMATEVQIRQQEASVKMLETMVAVRRATSDELDQARAKLSALRGSAPAATASTPFLQQVKEAPIAYERTVLNQRAAPPGDVVALMADVLARADELKRQEAELSNQLYKIPADVACPELTGRIIDLRRQIEHCWTEYRFMEKNHRAPDAQVAVSIQARPVELLEAERLRLRLADERSKLRKKLLDPRKSVAKELQWTQRLAVVQLELDGLDLTIKTLRA